MQQPQCIRCGAALAAGRESAIIYGPSNRPVCLCILCSRHLLAWIAEGVQHERQAAPSPLPARTRRLLGAG